MTLLANRTFDVCLCRYVAGLIVVAVGVVSNGTIQRPVVKYLLPSSTNCPRYRTSTPIPKFVNDTSHPASHSFTTEIREYDANPGTM